MKRFRDPNWVLIFLFVGILASVPLVQTIMEVRTEDGIKALDLFSDWPTASNLRSYEQNLEKASWAGKLSRPWLQFAQFAWLKEGGEKVAFGSPGWFFYKPGLKYMLARKQPAHSGTNDPVAAIVDFRDQLAALGIHLLVMPVPNKDSIYPDRLTPRAKLRSVMSPRTREVLEKLRAAKVEIVDLFKEFSEVRERSETPLYLQQDTHWSPAGVSLAAKAAAGRLNELGWTRPGAVEYKEQPAPVQRLGDIVHMLQVPMIEHHLKPEAVPAIQVVRYDDNQPYKDGIEGDVLVLGDSFMRIYQQDAPTAAGFIAHLAKELKQPMISLVNDGGGSTLVREELAGRPIYLQNKKVVLWEFVERDIGLGIKGWQRTRVVAPPSK